MESTPCVVNSYQNINTNVASFYCFSAISRQDTSRADAINNAVTILDILQGLPPPTPGHPPPSDSVAAQSLVTLGNQRCLCCAPPSSGRDHACHPPNTELTVSTNQENKWKKTRKKES